VGTKFFIYCKYAESEMISTSLLPKKILKGPSELNAENFGAQHMK